jgi:hypothetical protein
MGARHRSADAANHGNRPSIYIWRLARIQRYLIRDVLRLGSQFDDGDFDPLGKWLLRAPEP